MDNQKQEKTTLESLYAYLHESEEKSNREFAQMREEARRMREDSEKEWQKMREESERERQKMREESEKERQKIDEEAKKRSEDLDRKRAEIDLLMKENARTIHEINKTLGIIGNNNGEFAEEYFLSAFQKNPQLNGETYKKVITNMRFEEFDDEYDIFLSNDESVAIIEVKYSARKNDIGKLLQKAENFRKFLPRYNNRKLYLGIASLSFRKITENRIMEQGIAVIKQVGEKMVVYDKNLKVF